MIRMITKKRFLKTAAGAVLLIIMCFIAGISFSKDDENNAKSYSVSIEDISGVVYVQYSEKNDLIKLNSKENKITRGDRLFVTKGGKITLIFKEKKKKESDIFITRITLFSESELEIKELSVKTKPVEETIDGKETAVTELVLYKGSVEIVKGGMPAIIGVSLDPKEEDRQLNVTVSHVDEGDSSSGGAGEGSSSGDAGVGASSGGAGEGSSSGDAGEGSSSGDAEEGASPGDAAGGLWKGTVSLLTDEDKKDKVEVRIEGEAEEHVTFSLEESSYTFDTLKIVFGKQKDETTLDSRGGAGGGELGKSKGSPQSPEKIASEPPGEIADSFIGKFIDAVENGRETALFGMIDLDYSGIGGSRNGLVDMVREYSDTLSINWSIESSNRTDGTIVARISWSSSAGKSGTTTFWMTDTDRPTLTHADGEWFF